MEVVWEIGDGGGGGDEGKGWGWLRGGGEAGNEV